MENQKRRDRSMQFEFEIDADVQSVLEFMQRNIPACKLVGIAERMPGLARLLWDKHQQEPVQAVSLSAIPITLSERRSNASVSADVEDADGDSAVAMAASQPQ